MGVDLNNDEKLILENLINPDEPEANYYQYPLEVQQSILSSLIHDRYFLIQSLGLIKPGYFKNKAHSMICDIVFAFFKKYKERPKKHIVLNELFKRLENVKDKAYYIAEFEVVYSTWVAGLRTREYTLDEITEFAKIQSVKVALNKIFDLLPTGKDKWPKIWDIMYEACRTERNIDVGFDLYEDYEGWHRRMSDTSREERFTTGFKSLDDALEGGLARGEIGAWLGQSGGGKSVALVRNAILNLSDGKRVMYVSLEMNQDKIAKRMYSMLSELPLQKILEYKEDVKKALDQRVGEKDRLKLKFFPAGEADMNTIRAYYSQMQLYGFKPDLLIVDYVGEFKDKPGVAVWESRQGIVRDLRAFGAEEGHCTLTALQANRQGRQAQDSEGYMDDSNIGDSYGQVRPLDACWSINQNKTQRSVNVGIIWVVKHRDGKSRYPFYFEQNPNTLSMMEIGEDRYRSQMSKAVDKGIKGDIMKNKMPGLRKKN